MVHELFESALRQGYWEWNIDHESSPENYISKAKSAHPDLILLSNMDQKKDYTTVKELRSHPQLCEIPILLLTFAKDRPDVKLLQSLGVQGFVRKPFESSTLQEQIETVMRNQEKLNAERRKSELEQIDVVDDELLDLLSGKMKSQITINNLEGELDPTMQLHPIEAEIILQEDDIEQSEEFDESEETELLSMDDAVEVDSDEMEFVDPEETEYSDESDVEEIDEFDLNEAEIEAMEIELEEISLDYDEYDSVSIVGSDETERIDDSPATDTFPAPGGNKDEIRIIEVVESNRAAEKQLLRNQAPDDDLGYMDLEVVSYDRSTVNDIAIEGDTEEFDEEEGGEYHLAVSETSFGDSEESYSDLEVTADDSVDSIEIVHEEILEDLYDDSSEEEADGLELMELSVEEFEEDEPDSSHDFEEDDLKEIVIEDLDKEEFETQETDETEYSFETDLETTDDESALVEQDDTVNLEVDFDDDGMAFPEQRTDIQEPEDDLEEEEIGTFLEEPDPDSDSVSVDEEVEEEEVNTAYLDLSELEELDAGSSQLNIQEMINFRQVIKAKYEIPEGKTDGEFDDE
ncbi:MAG: response regulator transcription factor, partial [Proteobacteria bacterium]|nr:response regulator transcription factor [Pseudomonadota bacterium]